MGTAISRNSDISTNEFLMRFVSKEHISPDDLFWNRLLTFNIFPPRNSNEQLALDSRIEPLCQQILANNLTSGNFGALIEVFTAKVSELLSSTDSSAYGWQTFNALFIIRCITKYLTETVTEEQLIEHCEAGPNSGTHLELLIGSLVGVIVDVPLLDFTYGVHLESITTLIVLLSIQLHSTRRADQSMIFRLIMRGRHAIHAPLLIRLLLQHFIDQKKPPPGLLNAHGHSIVLGIAAELWSMITFNRKPTENGDGSVEQSDFLEAPLATQSLLLLLILTNHCTAQVNPYRQSLFSCVNSHENVPIPPSKAHSMLKIDYNALFTTLCRKATGDGATLLLYLLLHRNSMFKAHLLNRFDLDQLVIPILKTLYHAPNSNSHHIYMSLIILLILSEDDAFNSMVHETKVRNITWYTERSLTEISLGGLLVLVVIRTVQYNMLKMRDKYLHTNCLAALANMSAQFRDLHPYVSQRLVSLFETLAKKHIRLQKQMNPSTDDNDQVSLPVNATPDSELEIDLMVLEEVLRMVLEIFNSCLTSRLIKNPNLVYTLLYKKQIFEPFRKNSAFQDIIQNIELVIVYFSELLTKAGQSHELDVNEVLAVIENGAKHWPKEKMTKFPDLKFKYVEEEQPEEFFIPYVWALVCQQSTLHWSTEGALLSTAVC